MASSKKSNGGRGIVMTVAVGAMALIMILTMMLPSLSLIFAGNASSSSSQESDTSTPTTVAEADAKYQPMVDTLEQQLDADPNSLSALANLGYAYFDWASDVRSVILTIQSNPTVVEPETASSAESPAEPATPSDAETPATPAETSETQEQPASPATSESPQTPAQTVTVDDEVHQEDLFRRAEGYFDRYLALADSESVSVSRILCEYYLGNEAEATDQLAAFCKEHDFGPAWANLGMMYATAGEMDKAKAAFESAKKADPDDEYGSKSYAEQYLSYLEQIEQLTASLTSDGSGEVTTTVGADGTSVITLDGSGSSQGGSTTSGGTASSGSSSTTSTSAPTSLKDSVGGLF